jgi:DNA-binding NarL/FixJ family response regulator
VHSIRVLLGALPTTVRNAVSDAVIRQTDVELLGFAERPSELLHAAGTLRADVVVVETVDGRLPGIASHLVDQYPDIRVLAVTPEARTALIYTLRPHVDTVTGEKPEDLAAAIRATCTAGM